jgi:sugar phosphate isomerase/epimerase
MILTGIGDEAGANLETQIKAAQELGWSGLELRAVEVTGFPKANIHDIPDEAFAVVVKRMEEAELQVYCFGSAIANWSKKISDPFEPTLEEVKRCIPRMQRLGTKFVRIMSYKPGDDEEMVPPEVIRRVRDITKRFLDAGLQPVHENCMNYGGMSWRHAVRLVERCPGLKWLFDTGNPVCNANRSEAKPWPRQDAWDFWQNIRDYVAHIHVKDAVYVPAKNACDYKYPGEGDGSVRKILKDALARAYDGAVSIEPHLAAGDGERCNSFVQYGRRMETMLAELQSAASPKPVSN